MHENRHKLDLKKHELKHMVLQMSQLTGESFDQSLLCISHYNLDEAERIISNDDRINEYYVLTERTGFNAIASQQPVAHDLREIIAAMRIAGELERIADLAANIARIRMEIDSLDLDDLHAGDIDALGREVQSMFWLVMESYGTLDTDEAERLRNMETRIDESAASLTNALFSSMKSTPGLIEDGSRVLWIVHTLERIADRTTNIAEQVVYAVTAHEEKMN